MEYDDITLEKDHLIDYLSHKAALLAEEKINRHEEKRRQKLLTIIAVISALGVGAIYSVVSVLIKKEIDESLKSKEFTLVLNDTVKNSVNNEIRDLKLRMDGVNAYQQLSALSIKLDLGTSFSNADRDCALSLLAKIKQTGSYRDKDDFNAILTTIITSFASAFERGGIDKIDDLFRSEISTTEQPTISMLEHYARALITSPEISNRQSNTWDRFNYYSKEAIRWDYPTLGTFYTSLAEYKIGGMKKNDTIKKLLETYKFADPRDKEYLKRRYDQLSNPDNWQTKPDAMGREIGELVRGISHDYSDVLHQVGVK